MWSEDRRVLRLWVVLVGFFGCFPSVPFTPRSFHSRVVHWRKVNGTDEGRVTETDEM